MHAETKTRVLMVRVHVDAHSLAQVHARKQIHVRVQYTDTKRGPEPWLFQGTLPSACWARHCLYACVYRCMYVRTRLRTYVFDVRTGVCMYVEEPR
jgi:hypothetical protein